MVVIDTVIRYVPGVLGDPESVSEESHSQAGRLEYPQYTRPRDFRGMAVPDILLSGDHEAIAHWRQEQSEARSRANETNTERKEPDHAKQTTNPDRKSNRIERRVQAVQGQGRKTRKATKSREGDDAPD